MIARLTLSHFRSHRALDLTLEGRTVALFGPNGAGKTNLLESVSLLSPGRGLRRASAPEMVQRPGAPGWKVTAALAGASAPSEIETWSEEGAARQVRIDGKAARQTDLTGMLRVLWLQPAMDRLWIEGAEGRRRFLDRATMSLVPAHGDAALAYEKALRERNRLLREDHHDPAWYNALESRMAEAGAEVTANRRAALDRLTVAQEREMRVFPATELALAGSDALPETAGDLATFLAERRRHDLRAGRTMAGPHRHDLEAIYAAKGTPARDASTGEQKAMLVGLVLANARAIAAEVGAPPVLLLDEVAAHLDAERRAALYDELRALGAQAWMTATGQVLFAELGGDAMYLEVGDREGLSTVTERAP